MVEAATRIADTDGIEAVTLASIAGRLGIRSPSRFAHVDGLDGLRRRLALHVAAVFAATLRSAAQWWPSYKRAAVMQSLLAMRGLLGAVAAYASRRGMPALVGGLLLIFASPWTLIVIVLTNKLLLDPRARVRPPTRQRCY